jgi:acyl-CoA thioesterase
VDPELAPPGDFLTDTALAADPAHPGRFRGEIPTAWQVFSAFGGVSMAVGLRGIELALGRPDLRPVTTSATFCAPVPCGPVVVDATVLRDGRSAAQGASDLRVPGSEGVAQRMHATFGVDRASPYAFLDARMPTVPPPAECDPPPAQRPPDDPFPKINYHDQTEWRPALPTRAWDVEVQRATKGPAETASWFRLLKEPRLNDGTYDWAALLVPADILGPAVGRAVGAYDEVEPFFVLSLEIGVRFVARPETDWILQHCRASVAADGYATGDAHLWSEDGALLAIATQTAYLRSLR